MYRVCRNILPDFSAHHKEQFRSYLPIDLDDSKQLFQFVIGSYLQFPREPQSFSKDKLWRYTQCLTCLLRGGWSLNVIFPFFSPFLLFLYRPTRQLIFFLSCIQICIPCYCFVTHDDIVASVSWAISSCVRMCVCQHKCMLNHCLEWDKWMLNERTYPTPDSGLTHLFTWSRAVVAYTLSFIWSRAHA